MQQGVYSGRILPPIPVGVSGENFVKKVDIETIISPYVDFIHNEQQTQLEVLEYRLVLETKITRIVAERRADDNLARIRKSLELMEQNVNDGSIGLLGDNTFHEDISRATHNQIVHSHAVSGQNPVEQDPRIITEPQRCS